MEICTGQQQVKWQREKSGILIWKRFVGDKNDNNFTQHTIKCVILIIHTYLVLKFFISNVNIGWWDSTFRIEWSILHRYIQEIMNYSGLKVASEIKYVNKKGELLAKMAWQIWLWIFIVEIRSYILWYRRIGGGVTRPSE